MKRKYIYILMQLFTSICVVSVGFASWTFVSGDSIIASGSIKAEDIIVDNEIVSIDQTNLSLKYYKTGFVSTDEYGNDTVSDKGILSVTYIINLEKYREKNPSHTNLDILINLDCVSTDDKFNLFNNQYITCSDDLNFYITDKANDYSITLSNKNSNILNGSRYSVNFVLNNITDDTEKEIVITIDYAFQIVNKNHKKFYSDVYPKMSGITFKPSVMVNGE